MKINDIIKKHENQLLDLPNVTGVGIGEKNGEEVILVMVTRKVPESELHPDEVIPKSLNGFATDVIETGHIVAL